MKRNKTMKLEHFLNLRTAWNMYLLHISEVDKRRYENNSDYSKKTKRVMGICYMQVIISTLITKHL